MKIQFLSHGTPDSGVYTTYDFIPSLLVNPRYVSIREIVREYADVWLADLNQSFNVYSAEIEKDIPDWWMSSCSRLDCRPFGYEHLIKPLFFARGVVEWCKRNPTKQDICIVGMPTCGKKYLEEFLSTTRLPVERLQLEKYDLRGIPNLWLTIKQCSSALLESVQAILMHCNRRVPEIQKEVTLILFEKVTNVSNAKNYFFTTVLDRQINLHGGNIQHTFIGLRPWRNRSETQQDSNDRYLADGVLVQAVLRALWGTVRFVARILYSKNSEYRVEVGGLHSKTFFRELSCKTINGRTCFAAHLTFQALSDIVVGDRIRRVVYPYEEKCIERGILKALKAKNIKSIGYLMHPQHKLLLALRDSALSSCPKPTEYRVCGPAYVGMLTDVCRKAQESIATWGSGKSSIVKPMVLDRYKDQTEVLVLLSHPREAKILRHWLGMEPALSSAIFYLRVYRPMETSFKNFGVYNYENSANLRVLKGSLDDAILACDLAIFCGTSSGIEAILKGLLCIYVDINEFFQMEPFFGDFDPYFPCTSPQELASRLKWIQSLTRERFNSVQRNQQISAGAIFSPINDNQLDEDFTQSGSALFSVKKYIGR